MPPMSTSLHLRGLQSVISNCEKKLDELKALNVQCMAKPCDYNLQLRQSLTQQICQELKAAIEHPVMADSATGTAERSNLGKPSAHTDAQNEESVIYVRQDFKRTPRGRKEHKAAIRRSPRRQATSDFSMAPVPNGIYLAYWGMSKSWFAVLILTFKDVERFGLSKSMPACYDFDENTGQMDWKEGYEDGGLLTADRQFPVMFLENVPCIDRNAVGWVAAKDLQNFDPSGSQASLIPHYSSVIAFIHNRAVPQDELVIRQHTPILDQDVYDADENKARTVATGDDIHHETRGTSGSRSMVQTAPSRDVNKVITLTTAEKAQTLDTREAIRNIPAPIYLTKPICISATDHSPTCYDLPPLDADPSEIAEPLPSIRPLIDTTSAAIRYRTVKFKHSSSHITATYRKVSPRVRPTIDWPSLSKQKYKRLLSHPTELRTHGEMGGAQTSRELRFR